MNTYIFDIEVTVLANEEVVADSPEQAREILDRLLEDRGYVDDELKPQAQDLLLNATVYTSPYHYSEVRDYEEPGARERVERHLGKEVYE